MKKTLALDQALRNTGVCRVRTIKDGKPWYDAETFVAKKPAPAVYAEWGGWLIDELATDYDLVVIEQPTIPRRKGAQGTSMTLHEVAGIIRYMCARYELPLIVVPVPSLKNWAIGSSKEGKPTDAAREFFGLPELTDDEADAAWLAHIGYHLANEIDPGTDVRRKILVQLRKTRTERLREKRAERQAIDNRKAARAVNRETKALEATQRAQAPRRTRKAVTA